MNFFRILPFIILLFAASLFAQDIVIQKYIGKDIKEAVSNYGKPAFQDKNDPAMVMTFYKMPDRDYTFVSDSSGIYQANAALRYNDKNSAITALSKFLGDCLATGFTVDTLDVEKYDVRFARIDLKVSSGPIFDKNQYQITIEAHKRDE